MPSSPPRAFVSAHCLSPSRATAGSSRYCLENGPWLITMVHFFGTSHELTKTPIARIVPIVVGRCDVCSDHSHDHRLAVPRVAPRSCGLARLWLHGKKQRVFPPPKT